MRDMICIRSSVGAASEPLAARGEADGHAGGDERRDPRERAERAGRRTWYLEFGADALVEHLPGVAGGSRWFGTFDRMMTAVYVV